MPRPLITVAEASERLTSTLAKMSRKEWAGTHAAADRAARALAAGDVAAADLLLRRLHEYTRNHDGAERVAQVSLELADACREWTCRKYGSGMARGSKDLYLLRDGETEAPAAEDKPPWAVPSGGKS